MAMQFRTILSTPWLHILDSKLNFTFVPASILLGLFNTKARSLCEILQLHDMKSFKYFSDFSLKFLRKES